ncbi:MAG: phage holin family protein [Verrucomicrobiota bacterium]
MDDRTATFRNPAGHAGLLNNLLGLGNSLAGFFESRISLVASESKSALVHLLVLVGCLVAAGILFAFGYIFLLVSVVAAVAHALHLSWIWIALGIALLHFVLAIVCVLIVRSRIAKPVFRESLAELKKDRQWLKNLDKKNR